MAPSNKPTQGYDDFVCKALDANGPRAEIRFNRGVGKTSTYNPGFFLTHGSVYSNNFGRFCG